MLLPTLLHDRRDRLPVSLSLLPPVALAAWPAWGTFGVAFWWLANTVSHQAVHRRFFRTRWLEHAFSLWLSLLLFVPQRLWRQRHLAHHAGRAWRWRAERQLTWECMAVAAVVLGLALVAPSWLTTVVLPGLGLGFLLCWLHGHFEHHPRTTSVYAAWWNRLFLNDGYHGEHHALPACHYRDLPRLVQLAADRSPLPPVLRWLRCPPWLRPPVLLAMAEKLVLRCSPLRHAVLVAHRRALVRVLRDVPSPRRVVIVGGGLFPRTAILLQERWPAATIVVLDADLQHLERARPWLPAGAVLQHGTFVAGERLDADLVVLPLAFVGDRTRTIQSPPAPLLVVHDWWWRRPPGSTAMVAWWLGKRVTLVQATSTPVLAVGTS